VRKTLKGILKFHHKVHKGHEAWECLTQVEAPSSARGKKKARCSFASRRFPVYNLMKSFEVVDQSVRFFFVAPSLSLIDDTNMGRVVFCVKNKKMHLLSVFKA